jgi:pyrrolidone-carboxylate peptidase
VSTVEEQRAEQPVPAAIVEHSKLRAFEEQVDATTDPDALGRQLWQAAKAAGQDDRPLYWTRLRVAARLREQGLDPEAFELASRGMAGGPAEGGDGAADILVTGFDPYRLDVDVRRGNPSGAIALALDGHKVAGRRIRTMIFPVRYADFDAGLVERILGGYAPHAKWIVTVSEGRPDQFDLELWNGRRRSADRPDNAGVLGGGRPDDPVVPPGMPDGPEFIKATLPFAAMGGTNGAYLVQVNRVLTQLEAGLPHEGFEPGPEAVAVAGGGGGYLSNEIGYRNTRLLAELGGGTLGGHVHTPTLPVPPDDELIGTEMAQARADIVAQFVELLEAGLAAG